MFGSPKNIIFGLLMGILVGAAAFVLQASLGAKFRISIDPFVKVATIHDLLLLSSFANVCVLGPIVEELLFRGIIYGGYHRSLGPVVAAVLTTILFVVPHAPNLVTFPLALIGVLGSALTTLWLRVRLSAVGPAIAAHILYNVVTVIVTPVMS